MLKFSYIQLLVSLFPVFPLLYFIYSHSKGFSGSPVIKNLPAKAGDVGSIPDLGRSLGEGNGSQLQDSCLENSMDIGAWRAIVHKVLAGCKESGTI